MHLPTEPRITAPPELVRTALSDPALLARTLPGARMQASGAGALRGTLALWVGDRALAARGDAELGPPAGDDGPVTWLVSADHDGGDGSLDGAVRVEVIPSPGGCRLRVEVTGNARGWGEPADGRVLRHTADRLVGQLARNLETVLTSASVQAGAAGEGVAPPTAPGGSAGEGSASGPTHPDENTTSRRPGGRAPTAVLAGAFVAAVAAILVSRRRDR